MGQSGQIMDKSEWRAIPNASDRLKWYQNKGTLKLNFFLSIIFVGLILNGYDGILISGLQAIDQWHLDLNEPSATKIGLLNASGYFSGLVVGPIITYIDEKWGRRWGIRFYGWSLLSGSIVGCLAGIAGTNGYALFITGRILIGFGLASFLMTSVIVVQEISHPRSRSTVAASWNSYYILGNVISSWVVFGCTYMTSSWSWRIPYILQVPLALYVLIGVQFVPETPRFLLAKGREAEAFQFLVDYHGNGDSNDELVHFEFEEMKDAIRMEQEVKAEKWATIIRSKGSRYRVGLTVMITFLTNLSGTSIIYFYYTTVFDLVGITDPTTQTGISAGLAVFTWFVQIAAVFVGKRVGRRTIILWVWPGLLLGLIGLCVAGASFAHSDSGSTSAGIATVVLVWLFLGTFNAACPVLYSYPAEIQNYAIRSKGMLVWNTITQIEYAFVVYVDALGLAAIGWKYYMLYICLIPVQWALAYWLMVETKGYTLEEISTIFDGPDAIVSPADRLQAHHLSRDPVDGLGDLEDKGSK